MTRAQYLAQALANKPILILCFNRALAARLQQMVEERGLAATVSARSFHGWCNDQLRLYHLRPERILKPGVRSCAFVVDASSWLNRHCALWR